MGLVVKAYPQEVQEKPLNCFSYLIGDETLNVNSVINNNSFIDNDCRDFNFGINDKLVWIKLENDFSERFLEPTMIVNSTSIDHVDLYAVKNGEILGTRFEGRLSDIKDRFIDSHKIVFDLQDFQEAEYFLLNINNVDKKVFSGYISEKTLIEEGLRFESIFFGVLTGVFVGLFFYNLFLYFSVKDKIYIVYVLHTLLVWFAQASILGFTQYFIWNDWDWMNQRSIVIFSSLVSVVGIWFLRIFLSTDRFVPKLDKGFYFIYVVYAFILINALFVSITISYQTLLVTQSIVVLYVLLVASAVLKMGYRPARYYLLAWSIFMIGIFLFVFSEMGFIPISDITAYIMPFGSALEVVLLSFALADKINILKKEKEKEQKERLKVLKENEKLILEQNTVLEQKVSIRTSELEQALKNLQNTQSQLVSQEKMASLGQLTAGIAHEINNPINFVSSNISPLKRDIADIFEVINFYRNTASEEFSDSSKKKAKDLEEDLELDYVLDEVDQLLKGMEDGAKRTVEIVKGLRLFSRVDEQDVKKVDLHDGINSTIILLNSTMPSKIRIEREFGNLPMVECLAGKINQVFMNIINNAVHALGDHIDEIKDPKVTIRTKSIGDRVSIKIIDNGPGMSDSVKEKIFEPFFTTKSVGKGTGLGLSIVYSIIENHKGELNVNSEIGKGTTFEIVLPINQKAPTYEE